MLDWFSSNQSLLENLWIGSIFSIKIFCLTLLFSIPLGLLMALFRRHSPIISWPLSALISVLRGTPLILQILFFFFVMPQMMNGVLELFGLPIVRLSRFWIVIFAFSINYAAYFCEIFRAGIDSVSEGQIDAAKSLGFTGRQCFFRIVLPQAFKRVIPALANEMITLVKDTALASVIGVPELFRVAQTEATRVFSVIPLFVAGGFYFVANAIVASFFAWVEKKYNYYR